MRFAHDECLPTEEFDVTPLYDPRTGELVGMHRHQKPPWGWVPAWGGPDGTRYPIPCAYCESRSHETVAPFARIPVPLPLEQFVTAAEAEYNDRQPFPWQPGRQLQPGRRVGH